MYILNINKELIPLRISINIDETPYDFMFNYNDMYDYFTVDLLRFDEPIIEGEKVLIGKPLFTTIEPPFSTLYIPMDLSGKADRITFDNFGEDIFIFVFEASEIE